MDVDLCSISQPRKQRACTHEQWEVMRPLIKQLWADEKKTFKFIANVLAEEYNFLPTKRQFEYRTKQWGFPKYIKQKEMKAAVRQHQLTGVASVDGSILYNGRTIEKSRINRWKRRCPEFQSKMNVEGANDVAEVKRESEKKDSQDDKMAEDQNETSELEQLYGQKVSTNSEEWQRLEDKAQTTDPDDDEEVEKIPSAETKHNRHHLEDTTSRSDLSELFAMLSMSCLTHLSVIPQGNKPSRSADFLGSEDTDEELTEFVSSMQPKARNIPQPKHSSTSANLAWTDPYYLIAQQCIVVSDPQATLQRLYELSPFPSSIPCRTKLFRLPGEEILDSQLTEQVLKLKKHQKDHPLFQEAICLDIIHGKALCKESKWTEAEHLLKDVADFSKLVLGFKNSYTLFACRWHTYALLRGGKFSNAFEIQEMVSNAWLKAPALEQDDSFFIACTMVCFGLFGIKSADLKCFAIEYLQIVLQQKGFLHIRTMMLINFLANVLQNRGENCESEFLHRTTLELGCRISHKNFDTCESLAALAKTLEAQNRFDEAVHIAQCGLTAATDKNHKRCYFRNQRVLALCFHQLRKLNQFESFPQIPFKLTRRTFGLVNLVTLGHLYCLALSYHEANRFEIAAICFIMDAKGHLKLAGKINEDALDAIRWLGECLTQLAYYEDALLSFQLALDEYALLNSEDKIGGAFEREIHYLVEKISDTKKILENLFPKIRNNGFEVPWDEYIDLVHDDCQTSNETVDSNNSKEEDLKVHIECQDLFEGIDALEDESYDIKTERTSSWLKEIKLKLSLRFNLVKANS